MTAPTGERRRCGNCGARNAAGGQVTCHRHPPPWEPVDPVTGWCFQWVPDSRAGEGIVVTEQDVDAALAGGLTDRRVVAAVLTLERRLDRGGL